MAELFDPYNGDEFVRKVRRATGDESITRESLHNMNAADFKKMFDDIKRRRTERPDETTRREREQGEARSRAAHPSAGTSEPAPIGESILRHAYADLVNIPVHPVHPTPVPLPGNIPLGSILLQSTLACPNCSGLMLHAHCAGADCRALYCSGCTCVWRPDLAHLDGDDDFQSWFVRAEVDG